GTVTGGDCGRLVGEEDAVPHVPAAADGAQRRRAVEATVDPRAAVTAPLPLRIRLIGPAVRADQRVAHDVLPPGRRVVHAERDNTTRPVLRTCVTSGGLPAFGGCPWTAVMANLVTTWPTARGWPAGSGSPRARTTAEAMTGSAASSETERSA